MQLNESYLQDIYSEKSMVLGNEARVYELIVRHFLACVSQDAQGKETTVNIDINGEKFIAHGLTVIQKNYLEVYIYEKWSDKQIANYESIKEFDPTSIGNLIHCIENQKFALRINLSCNLMILKHDPCFE